MVKGIEIFCKNINEYLCVQGGETLSEIFSRIADRVGIKPICAKVNNKTETWAIQCLRPSKWNISTAHRPRVSACMCARCV